MVYSYDRNIQMPTKDLYDTQIMAMALNVAKDEYEKAEKRLDNLNKLYGDFYSPSDVDMKNWQTYVVDPIKNQLDDLYASGIDPLRSAEGRAILSRASRDVSANPLVNKLKQSATIGQKYLTSAAELQAKGLYNPDYENRYLGYDIKNWDTLKNGVWNRMSPDPVASLQDATVDWYKNRTARALTPEEVTKEGVAYDPRQDYTGFLNPDLLSVAGQNIPGFIGSQLGGYYADLAKRELQAEAVRNGEDPAAITQEDVNDRLARNIANANKQFYIGPTGKVNPFAMDDYQTANDIKAHRQKAAITAYYSNRGGGNGGGSYTEAPYSTKVRMFNEGLANLLGVSVDVVADVAKDGKFVHDRIIENQTGMVNRFRNGDDLIAAFKEQTPYSRQEIADVLELKQVGDGDEENNVYTMSKNELKNIVDSQYIVSRIKTSDPLDAGTNDAGTKAMRSRYRSTYRTDMKVEPTGDIVTYLDKDGTIKKYAELEIVGGNSGSGETVYIDLGNNSTKIDGSNAPIGIDYTQSTKRDYGYEQIDKKMSSNQTKSIKTSYNR